MLSKSTRTLNSEDRECVMNYAHTRTHHILYRLYFVCYYMPFRGFCNSHTIELNKEKYKTISCHLCTSIVRHLVLNVLMRCVHKIANNLQQSKIICVYFRLVECNFNCDSSNCERNQVQQLKK